MFSFIKAIQNLLANLKKRKGLWFSILSAMSIAGIFLTLFLITNVTKTASAHVYEDVSHTYKKNLDTRVLDKQKEYKNIVLALKSNSNFTANLNNIQIVDETIKKYNDNLNTNGFDGIAIKYYPLNTQVNIFRNSINAVINRKSSLFGMEVMLDGPNMVYLEPLFIEQNLVGVIEVKQNLISFKQIITSRLCIIFYRLTYFDLDASKASIGRIFTNIFGESESFKINLNRNPNGWFFTDLNNKIFRGYKMNSLPTLSTLPINNESDLKIKIAKKLLSNNIKLKIVAEAIEMKEEELKNFIYGNNSSSLNINNNFRISPNFR